VRVVRRGCNCSHPTSSPVRLQRRLDVCRASHERMWMQAAVDTHRAHRLCIALVREAHLAPGTEGRGVLHQPRPALPDFVLSNAYGMRTGATQRVSPVLRGGAERRHAPSRIGACRRLAPTRPSRGVRLTTASAGAYTRRTQQWVCVAAAQWLSRRITVVMLLSVRYHRPA
jgi:hypothetical protein